MIGQEKLLKTLNKYTIKTLPKTMLFLGESGCGKHTIIKMLAERLNLEIVEIDENVDTDTLIEYQQDPIQKMYVIDLSNFNEKQQNQFLKFIEEPSINMYISIIASSSDALLYTILNRCTIFEFLPYTINELKQVKNFDNELIYKICKTPGQLLNFDPTSLESLYELCQAIITKISKASYANTLSISNKCNFKEEYDKYDINVLFNMLEQTALEEYVKNKTISSFNIYMLVNDYKQMLIKKSYAKEVLMLQFLSKLWKSNQGAR